MRWESLDCRRGQLRAWHGYSWAEPNLAAACVTQGMLQIDFGSSPFTGCQGPVRVKKKKKKRAVDGEGRILGVGQEERGF